MRRIRLYASLLSLLIANPAAASPPDPANCDVPDLILLVARGPGGAPDALGTFLVVIRDFNGVPEEDYPVTLDFSDCPDARLCADQGDPTAVVDCAARTITMSNNLSGEFRFRVLGFAANVGASGSTGPCLEVWTDGIYLKTVRVAVLDQMGGNGLDANDLSAWLADSFSRVPYARSDYDGDGTLSPNDLSSWLAAYFAGSSAVSGGAPCP
jgi:hypothetical protein